MKKTIRDTDATIHPHFSQHGRMESRIENNILINEATGPFNAEIIYAIKMIQRDLLAEISALDSWAQIYIFRDSALCSPDTIDALRDYLTELKGKLKKPVATAFVMGRNVEGSSIMGPHYRHVYEAAELNFQIFSTEQGALDWVTTTLIQP